MGLVAQNPASSKSSDGCTVRQIIDNDLIADWGVFFFGSTKHYRFFTICKQTNALGLK